MTNINTHGYKKFKQEVDKMAVPFINAFNRRKRSFELLHSTHRKTGKLDPRRLHSYNHSEDLFKSKSIQPRGKNHYMCLLVDRSFSMNGKSNQSALTDAAVLATFCRTVGIDFNIFTYTTGMRSRYEAHEDQKRLDEERNGKAWFPNGAHLVELFSSKMSERDFRIAMRVCCSASKSKVFAEDADILNMGGTPTAESVLTAKCVIDEILSKKSYDSKTFMLMTDGASCTNIGEADIMIDRNTNEVYKVDKYDPEGRKYVDPILSSVVHKMSEYMTTLMCIYGSRRYFPVKGLENDMFRRVSDDVEVVENCAGFERSLILNLCENTYPSGAEGLAKVEENFRTKMASKMRYKMMSKEIISKISQVYS